MSNFKIGLLFFSQQAIAVTKNIVFNKIIPIGEIDLNKDKSSIFNIINLKDKDMMFILDEDILKCEKVGFHPNINTETVIFNPKELNKIFEYYNVNYKFIAI